MTDTASSSPCAKPVHPTLGRLFGWETFGEIPYEATFSRALAHPQGGADHR